jgi:6,7-dimethyl-8-ribityllumazine synthase
MPTVLSLPPPGARGIGRRIAIAVARFTAEQSERMLDDAVAALIAEGVDDRDITVAWVPGSFELPLACEAFAQSGRHDGVIALGCVIRGETSHYDYVCEAAARGVLATGLKHGRPVIFGVLTTENRAQAEARIDGTKGHKGRECASAVLEMLATLAAIRSD